MLPSRCIHEHRSTIILVVLVVMSLVSLATGAEGVFLRDTIRKAISVTAYPFLKAMGGVTGATSYVTGLFSSHTELRREVDDLRKRLVEMSQNEAQRHELVRENERLRNLIDFVRSERRFDLEPVKVDVMETFKGILLIDRGSLHGMHESMCAVTEDGIVGLVTRVDPTTSSVVTLQNADCKVGAMIVRNRVRGIVHGSSSELSYRCTMKYIDMKDDVRVNDLVVSSPESMFPAGYTIGRVVKIDESGSLWKSAEIEPAVDIYSLDEVFIVRRAIAPAEELAGQQSEPAVVSVAPAVPDTRSYQDRYAP